MAQRCTTGDQARDRPAAACPGRLLVLLHLPFEQFAAHRFGHLGDRAPRPIDGTGRGPVGHGGFILDGKRDGFVAIRGRDDHLDRIKTEGTGESDHLVDDQPLDRQTIGPVNRTGRDHMQIEGADTVEIRAIAIGAGAGAGARCIGAGQDEFLRQHQRDTSRRAALAHPRAEQAYPEGQRLLVEGKPVGVIGQGRIDRHAGHIIPAEMKSSLDLHRNAPSA